MLSDEQRHRLEEEKNSFEQVHQLQTKKIARIRNALIIEADPSRQFQYEQMIQQAESELKKLTDKLDNIEKQLLENISQESIPVFRKKAHRSLQDFDYEEEIDLDINTLVQKVQYLQVDPDKIAQVKQALDKTLIHQQQKIQIRNNTGELEQEQKRKQKEQLFADHFQLDIQQIQKFFIGSLVKADIFIKICSNLKLEYPKVVYVDFLRVIALVVPQVKSQRYEKIQNQCSTMRMLDISKPVVLSDIYTDVNILEQIISLQWRDVSELVQIFNPELDNFDRLGLSNVHLSRLPGLDVVSHYSNLMILGKPGAGKTIFLQWIAVKCNLNEFMPDKVPIFIKLKTFAEYTKRKNSEFKLLNYITEEFSSCRIVNKSVIDILTHGQALILLDGLDEVSEEEDDEVNKQIRSFIEKYFKNKFIITCRIAAHKYRFTEFTDVEIADFNQKQIKAFAQKWFVAVARNSSKAGETKASQFIKKLNLTENQQIRELAVTPILLNLTCLVFQEKDEFPSKRSKLYNEGLEILLRKWDNSRDIIRDEVYRNLSLEHKIELLSYVAKITFEKNQYFFEKSQVVKYIADYIRTFLVTQTDQVRLRLDSNVILKSIEAQHGLLVERARQIYSFSHLTFQEYFTALAFTNNCQLEVLEQLVNYISKKSWREIFLLTTEMVESASELLLLMKQKIDVTVAKDEKLQQFLKWLSSKKLSVEIHHKSVVVRALYFDLFFSSYDTFTPDCDKITYYDNSHIIVLSLERDLEYIFNSDIRLPLAGTLDQEITTIFKIELQQSLQQLKTKLPNDPRKDLEKFNAWWQIHGQVWTEHLKIMTTKYSNISQNWLFSAQQKKLLRQYYDTNKLLVECLNNSEVSHEIRQEIEDNLLLPIAEIEKR